MTLCSDFEGLKVRINTVSAQDYKPRRTSLSLYRRDCPNRPCFDRLWKETFREDTQVKASAQHKQSENGRNVDCFKTPRKSCPVAPLSPRKRSSAASLGVGSLAPPINDPKEPMTRRKRLMSLTNRPAHSNDTLSSTTRQDTSVKNEPSNEKRRFSSCIPKHKPMWNNKLGQGPKLPPKMPLQRSYSDVRPIRAETVPQVKRWRSRTMSQPAHADPVDSWRNKGRSRSVADAADQWGVPSYVVQVSGDPSGVANGIYHFTQKHSRRSYFTRREPQKATLTPRPSYGKWFLLAWDKDGSWTDYCADLVGDEPPESGWIKCSRDQTKHTWKFGNTVPSLRVKVVKVVDYTQTYCTRRPNYARAPYR